MSKINIYLKCGYEDENQKNISIHCIHGIKFEPIAQMLYLKNNIELHEFGSIRHKNLNFIAASPDGISSNGIMSEIKCPLKKIYGIPPIYYWYQMQQQLEVCNLNSCDFLECDIKEISWEQYKNEYNNDNNSGIIIEYINKNETDPWNIYGWKYPPNSDKQNIMEWIKKLKVNSMKINYSVELFRGN